jgi:retron-type reverse transcriptase
MEDGGFSASEQGTPQGGLVSPALANIYLHYVLDVWFEKRFVDSVKQHGWLNDNHLDRLDGDDCRRLMVHVMAP